LVPVSASTREGLSASLRGRFLELEPSGLMEKLLTQTAGFVDFKLRHFEAARPKSTAGMILCSGYFCSAAPASTPPRLFGCWV